MKPSITSEQEITRGQKDTCITQITDATRKAAGVAIDELVERGVLNRQSLQRVMTRSDEIVTVVTEVVKQKFAELAENILGCLQLISGAETLTLDPTDGTRTLAGASNIFTGGLDCDFKNWGTGVRGKPSGPTNVTVHEMIKDGDFRTIYGGVGSDLTKLCLEQDQIIQFVERYRKWLRTDGYATFFLFKVGGEFFVARVGVGGDGLLRAFVDRFSHGLVWRARSRLRFVLPQLPLET